MTTVTKPDNHAFVLNPKKVSEFFEQDNRQFKNFMEKFEKINKKESHSNINK